MDLLHGAVAFGAAFLSGAINSVAGGGTLVSFPTLIWLGLPSITANATSTVANWPGSLGGLWGYRKDLGQTEPRLFTLMAPSVIGGILGALLLKRTPSGTFDRMVPFLILFATLLFMAQKPVQRLITGDRRRHWLAGAIAFQFLVALYGGYFGAGIGILMLAALSIMGLKDIHQMNGLKIIFTLCINGVAAAYFVWSGMVYWPDALIMAGGAIVGGYGGAGAARRAGRETVRRVVIGIGFTMAVAMFIRTWILLS